MMLRKQPADYDLTLSQAEAVCRAIHGVEPFGLVYMWRDPSSKGVKSVEHSYGTFDEQKPTLIKRAAAGWEPFMQVGLTNSAGHAREKITGSWAVAVDFDDELPELLEVNELVRPTILISTSPGRYHAVWILNESCTPQQMHFLTSVLQDRLGGDPAFARTNQAARLPGFVNRKNEHKVKLAGQGNLDSPYSYDFLCQAFDAPLVANRLCKGNHRYDKFLSVPSLHSAEDIVEDVRSALKYVPHMPDDYHDWQKIGVALGGLGDAGRLLFHEFSTRSEKYDAGETDKKWVSLSKLADSSSVKTIFAAAQRAGWKNPGFRNNAAASHLLTDRDFGALCAKAMEEYFAVIEPSNAKGGPIFLKLKDGAYAQLSDIEKRREVEQVCKQVISKLSSENDDSSFKSTWMKKIGTNKGLNEVCEHIAEVLILTYEGNKVRSYPYLPVAKGVLNMLSREMVPMRYMPVPTCAAPVHFDPTATAPLFARVVQEIFEEDEEMVRFIFQFFGLILLGKPEQYFFVWLGPTANNGKSLLLKTLKSVLGPYYTFLPTAALMMKSHTTDGANPAIAQLAGKRLAVTSEPTAKQALDSSLIKQFTGDGHINVRDNYGGSMPFPVEIDLGYHVR